MYHNAEERARKDIFWGEIAPCDHILQIYDNDQSFLDMLQAFVTNGISNGDSVIVIATCDHLKLLNDRLRETGLDLFALALRDQYMALEAQETLDQFMIRGWPDENLFNYVLTNLLSRARKHDRRVRAFGEMVALLWSQGLSGATVHLEHLWSRFCSSEAFSVFCAYPRSGFTEDMNHSLAKICSCHSKMINSIQPETQEVVYTKMAG